MRTFYTTRMSPPNVTSTSNSPLKPALFMEYLMSRRPDLYSRLDIYSDFIPSSDEDIMIAHTREYVDYFFAGREPMCSSNHIEWSPEFADSVRYTVSGLYHAIRYSVEYGSNSLCPVSGFHHAIPSSGIDFCTFSGQVIASVKNYRETGIAGAYIDLDGHYGNSIDDSRKFAKDLDLAVPRGGNCNPTGHNFTSYVRSMTDKLDKIEILASSGKIQYVVYCHGADSHENDDLGVGVLSTNEWLECTRIFNRWLSRINEKVKLPAVICLFGGYRENFDEVLELHAKDLEILLNKI